MPVYTFTDGCPGRFVNVVDVVDPMDAVDLPPEMDPDTYQIVSISQTENVPGN